MAPRLNNVAAQLRSDFDKFCEELYDFIDRREYDIEFDHGKTMAESHCEMMKISYAESASKAFWKPYVDDAKLEEALEDHEKIIEDIEQSSERGPTQTVEDAYLVSLQYSDFLWFCVWRSTVDNPVFDGPEGCSRFERIFKDKIWDDVHVETRLMFGTPGYPHLTILSIQPQQAPTKKLMYTEFWLLYYWAVTLCSRVRYNSNKCLPIRLVSLCDRRARVISAVFSSGYTRCLSKSGDPRGEDVSCKVHIGDYYDFRESASCLSFAKELIAEPTGTETMSKEALRAKRNERPSKVLLLR